MIIIEKKQVTIKSVSSIVCDKCQKSIDKEDLDFQEVYEIYFIGGYSSVFGDDCAIDCQLCQNCLLEIIGDFCRMDGKTKAEWDKINNENK
jgi:hypothetical protein